MRQPDRLDAPSPSAELSLKDVTASTVANIGPGIDFYFAFGVIAVTAGVGAPLTILSAGIAVCFLAFVVAEFTRIEPSAGSFITYVETSLGPRAGAVTVAADRGRFHDRDRGRLHDVGRHDRADARPLHRLAPEWLPIALVMTVAAVALTLRGASPSTAAVATPSSSRSRVMLASCCVVLVDQRAHLSAAPFSWSHLNGGLAGLSAGFPLALYMFIGWENGPALAEETPRTRGARSRGRSTSRSRSRRRCSCFFAYTTIVGFHYDTSSIGRASVPFLEMADRYLGAAAVLAWLAGIISVLATLVAGRQLAGPDALRRRPLGTAAGAAGHLAARRARRRSTRCSRWP